MPFVEQTVTETRTQDSTDRDPEEELVRPFLRTVLMLVHPAIHHPAYVDTDRPHQAVPANTSVPEMYQDRVHIPHYRS